jgi:hypothetical protein
MLRDYLKMDLRRAFINLRFPFKCVLVSLLLLYNKNEPSDIATWMSYVGQMQLIIAAMAVASATYITSYIDERDHKYSIQLILRGNVSNYIASKLIVVFLSTVVTFLVGFWMTLSINYFRLGIPNEEALEQFRTIKSAYSEFVTDGKYELYFMACAMHLAVFAGLMALIGFVIIQFVNSRVVAYCFPMMSIYIEDIFLQRLFGWEKAATFSLKCIGINQIEMLLPGQSVVSYYFQIICYIIIIFYVCIHIAERKTNG